MNNKKRKQERRTDKIDSASGLAGLLFNALSAARFSFPGLRSLGLAGRRRPVSGGKERFLQNRTFFPHIAVGVFAVLKVGEVKDPRLLWFMVLLGKDRPPPTPA